VVSRRRIQIEFPKSQTRAVAELLDDRAPKTCDAIWAVLAEPVERQVLHAAWTGENVVFYDLPPIERPAELPLENHRVRAGAGELMFFYQPAGRLAGLYTITDWLHPNGEVFEVGFSYGVSDLTGPAVEGWRGSHWATIVENLAGFAAACRQMRIDGAQQIRLSRIES
jgi:hypothetical protein